MTDQSELLNTCGCCSGTENPTPASIENRPGLSALVYRVGTHGQFKTAMKNELSRCKALEGLSVREDNDFSIALLDAWSVTADVLTFYQERIANEGFLRTAVERLSVLQQARLIGYELSPGVAASAYLAFTVEDQLNPPIPVVPGAAVQASPGELDPIIIDRGTRVQSIPGQDELPQTFETIEKIKARSEWNELKPLAAIYEAPRKETRVVYLKGTSTNLKPGDALLFIIEPGGNFPVRYWDFCKVKTVKPNYTYEHTKITLDRQLNSNYTSDVKIYALRQKASVFGHNAPDWKAMSPKIRLNYTNVGLGAAGKTYEDWPGIEDPLSSEIYLDSVYPGIFADSWLVLSKPSNIKVCLVNSVEETSHTGFTLSSKVTKITIIERACTNRDKSKFLTRETTVYARSEKLDLAEKPIEYVEKKNTLLLDKKVPGLKKGQIMILTGETEDGERASEILELLDVEEKNGFTKLTFTEKSKNRYKLSTVTINANVALATHGETVTEVLGSGDASQAFQRFPLRQPPLTYTRATTPSGIESTLQIRVNDLLWKEVPSFYNHGPEERIYITRMDDNGNTIVQFGDGITGSRVPTGQENIIATFRKGIGLDGMVKAGQLSMLMTRSYGLKEVYNPFASADGVDPEKLGQARQNCPLTVLTLDRVVSLRDFEDFARAFPGIEKARADWVWDGETRKVFLTIAAAVKDITVDENSMLHCSLRDAVKNAGNGCQPFNIESYEPLTFSLEAKIHIDPRFIKEKVINQVKATLIRVYSFEQRQLAQPVTKSEVMAVIQGVDGVDAVDLDKLYIDNTDGEAKNPKKYLAARRARCNQQNEQTAPAELLTLNPSGIEISLMEIVQ